MNRHWLGKIKLLVMVLAPFMSLAETAVVNGVEWLYQISDGEATIKYAVSPLSGSVVVPSSISGYPISYIDEAVFQNQTGVTSVTIPNGVRLWTRGNFFGPSAMGNFSGCSNLRSLSVPSVGELGFLFGTRSYEGALPMQHPTEGAKPTYYIPGSLTSVVVTAPGESCGMFGAWEVDGVTPYSWLTSISIANGPTSIGENAFRNCTKLSGFVVPASVKDIGFGAFYNCQSLKSVTIPEGVVGIQDAAFALCEKLESLSIPASVSNIGGFVFRACNSLQGFYVNSRNAKYSSSDGVLYNKAKTDLLAWPGGKSAMTMPASVKNIAEGAVCQCRNVKFVTIPSSVTNIGRQAFQECTGLKSVVIPSGVTDIGDFAFGRCSNLVAVTIPTSVTNLGNGIFGECASISAVTTSCQFAMSELFPDDYQRIKTVVIDGGVSEINSDMLLGCVGVKELTIPLSVSKIESGAFSSCVELEKIFIKYDGKTNHKKLLLEAGIDVSKVEIIYHGANVVDNIPWLFVEKNGGVVISSGRAYGSAIPADTTGSIVVPEMINGKRVIGVDDYAFCYCAISEVRLPDAITSIGEYAFLGCKSLIHVWWSRGAETVKNGTFAYCSKLESIYLPDSVKSVSPGYVGVDSSNPFGWCVSLKKVYIDIGDEKHVRELMRWVLSERSIEIIDSAAVINGVKWECSRTDGGLEIGSGKENVSAISNNVVGDVCVPSEMGGRIVCSIGDNAFYGCREIVSVTIPSTVKSIGFDVFKGCNSLVSIFVEADNSVYCSIDGVLFDKMVTRLIYCPSGKKGDLVMPESVTSIDGRAFSDCTLLERVCVPWGVNVDAIPSTIKVVRPVSVVISSSKKQFIYDGEGKRFGATLVPNVGQYDVANVTNTLPILIADVGSNQLELTAEMFWNTNENYEVTFVVNSENKMSEVAILPRPVTVTTGSAQKVYDGMPLVCADITVGGDGFVGGECVAKAIGSQTNVGSSKNTVCLEWAKGALESNYSIVTNEGTLTVLPAKVAGAGEEPGAGAKPVAGISKFDGEAVKYDGKGHTINVAALEAVTLVADTPAFSYSMTSNGVYQSEPYYFTNACVTSFWYKVSATNYEDYVHEARVTILPREVTLTSGSASKNFDGTALRCESVEVTGNGFVAGEGVDVVYTGSQLWPGASENTFTYSFKQGTLESNYDVTTANGTLTVGAAGRVVVDASVTAIPAGAFKNYTELTEVVLPDTVTEIGADAFAGCTKLTKVAFPSGMEVTREKLRGWGLTDAVLDDYVEGDFIIVNTSLLGYVGAADVAELVIPDGIELIDEYALSDLDDLERVELPETVKYIGKGAFANDTYLDEVVLPDSVEVIGKGAFENCSWMQTMTMGAGVRSVGDRAFAGCTKLAAAKFAEGLGDVGDAAFSNCWRMMSVSLPASVSNVAATAFKDCASLTGVTVPTMIAPMSEWLAPVYRQVENVTVPEGTTEVCAEMFAGCAELKMVELPEGVTNIASGAFRDCAALETILLPESLEAIGDEAFAGCAALKAIVLPKNVAVLGKRVFSGCAALSDVTLSRALTAIPDGTFTGCDVLDSFVVPESVTELGSQIVPSATTAIYYLGNAPAYAADVYAQANASLVSYVVDGTKGWDGRPTSRDIPQTWPTSNARTIRTWSPVKVDVTFVGNGGAFGNPAEESCVCEQIVDTAYSLPPYEPVRKGYRFDGYWTEANGGTRVTSGVSVKLTKAHSLYAHWAVGQSVTVRFNATGGTVEPEERVYVSEAPFGELPVPVRTHYDFAGWFTEASGGTQVTAAFEVPLADRELFAHWTAKQYVIRFHANDGMERMTDQAFTYGATVTLAKNGFVREGYTFAGWATSAKGVAVYADGKTLDEVSAIQDGVIHLYAVWTANGYEVRFDANGGEGTMVCLNCTYGTAKALTACAFTRTGYTFAGWATSAGGQVVYANKQSVKNLTVTQGAVINLYAKWTANAYSVKFDANGGSGTMANGSMTYDAEKALTACAFTRTGYTFAGWATSAGGAVKYADGAKAKNLAASGTVTLYAKWNPIAYSVKFNANGGSGSMANESMTYDTEKALTACAFAKTGYTFAGWEQRGAAGVRALPDCASVKNLTAEAGGVVNLYAVWTVNFYALTVKPNSTKYGSVSGGGTYETGEKVTLKATAKSGYVFAGWYTDKACTKELRPEGYDNRKPTIEYVMPAKKMTIYAKFISKSSDKKSLKFSSETAKLAKSAKSFAAGKTMSLGLGFTAKSLPKVTAKDLPDGMEIDPVTGEITGTPTEPGKHTVTVTVKSAAGNTISQKVKIYVTVPSGYYGTFDGYALVKTTPAYVTFTSDKYGAVSGKVTYKGKGYSFKANYSEASSSRAKFKPSIKIGSTTYKPVTYVTKATDGITVSEARGEQKGKFVFVAQKKPGLIKSKKVLAGLIDQPVKISNKQYADAKLPKSSDYLKLKFAATDAVKVTGKLKGKSVSFSTTVIYCRAEVTEAGDVYTAEAALVEPKSGYSRLATFTLTVGADGKVTKKVSFGKIK